MRVSSADLLRNFGTYSDAALNEPVIVTRNGRDRLVLISIGEFEAYQTLLRNRSQIRDLPAEKEEDFIAEMRRVLREEDDHLSKKQA